MEKALNQGVVESYIHSNRKVGVLLELRCETDFVARTDEFKTLAHELCLQVAALNPKKSELMGQPWIKDAAKTIKDLITEYAEKLGENIVVKRFIRYEL
ncbi:MAG: elongation factor T [Parcubacteria group bacterium Gr01-1014_30]|nr:MAG: elongation factor T [Parcubacteria group bacterium Gr01-1014_30]